MKQVNIYRFIKLVCCAALLCGGILQAAHLEDTNLCDSDGNCTLSGSDLNTTTSEDTIYGAYSEDDMKYKTITVTSDVILKADTASNADIIGIWQSLDSVTNNGTLTNTDGGIIRVGSGGYVETLYNYGTMTSENSYALRISDGGVVENIYNGSADSPNATISGIYILGTVVSNFYNYGEITKYITVEGGSINEFDNAGTVTGDINVSSGGEIGKIDNAESGTITGNVNVSGENSTIGELDNAGTITGDVNVSDSGEIGTVANSGTLNGDVNVSDSGEIGTVANSGTIEGDVNVSDSGEIGTVANSGTIEGDVNVSDSGSIDKITNNTSGTINGDINVESGGSILWLYNYNDINGDINVSDGATLSSMYNYGTIYGDVNVSNSGEDGGITYIRNYGEMNDVNVESGGQIGWVFNNDTINSVNVESGGQINYIDNESTNSLLNEVNIAEGATVWIVNNDGTMGTINNAGTITADISNSGTLTEIYNTGYVAGVYNYGTLTLIDNDGGEMGRIFNSNGGEIETINIRNGGKLSANYSIENFATIGEINISDDSSVYRIYNRMDDSVTGTIDSINVESGSSIAIVENEGATINSITVSDDSEINMIVNRLYKISSTGEKISGEIVNIEVSDDSTINKIYNAGTIDSIEVSSDSTINDLYNNYMFYDSIYEQDIEKMTAGEIGSIVVSDGGSINNVYNNVYEADDGEITAGTIDSIEVSDSGSITNVNNNIYVDEETGEVIASEIGDITVSSEGTITSVNNDGTIDNIEVNTEGTITSVNNDGTIDSIEVSDSGSITNVNNDNIYVVDEKTGEVIEVIAGEIGSIEVSDSGSITNVNNNIYIDEETGEVIASEIGDITVSSEGEISNVNNSGEITGDITVSDDGSIDKITNNESGTITSDITVESGGEIGTVTNAGEISGDINVSDSGSIDKITNSESGIITGDVTVESGGEIGTVTNAGEISGDINVSDSGSIDKITNSESGTITGDIEVSDNGAIGTLDNAGEIDGTIVLDDDGSIDEIINEEGATMSDIESSGDIGSITNKEGATMGNITSSGDIENIYNAGTMGGITYNGDTTLNIYNKETGVIRSDIKVSDDNYVQISGSNINIGEYYFDINESADDYNSFEGYTSEDGAEESSSTHLAVQVTDGGSITLGDGIVLSIDDEYIDDEYNIGSLIIIYDENGDVVSVSDYADYGIDTSVLYETISLDNNLEYYISLSGESISKATRTTSEIHSLVSENFKKYSPAHTFYKNNVLIMNTLLTQSESIMYSTSYQRYGFRNASQEVSARFNNGFKRDYVISSKKPYSDFIQTAAYDEDYKHKRRNFNNESSQDNMNEVDSNTLESSDDYFFFSPFISSHSLYGNGVNGTGLSYGFISGYNREIGNALFGLHIGFDYGNITGDDSAYFDTDSISALLGLHYRYDFSNGMYIKARGDFYYAYHTINDDIYTGSYSAITKQHPNSLGFNLGITTGKQWNITDSNSAFYGIFNIEGGLNYMGLNSSDFEFYGNYNSAQYTEAYNDLFMNLLYANLDVKYDKMFGDNWIINMALGIKALLTPLPEAKISVKSIASGASNVFDVSSKIYTDRVFGTLSIGLDYMMSDKVSFMVNYVGIYGDQSMSNSGFFNIRVWW